MIGDDRPYGMRVYAKEKTDRLPMFLRWRCIECGKKRSEVLCMVVYGHTVRCGECWEKGPAEARRETE